MNKITLHPHKKDTLYYDASCALCSKEIGFVAKHQYGHLQLLDIHTETPSELSHQKDAMLKILHLYKKEGHCMLGLDATVEAWSHTPYGWLVRFLRWPLIKPAADKVYFAWANTRYKKKYQCGICKL